MPPERLYDEKQVLFEYLKRWYSTLLTSAERKAAHAIIGRAKLANMAKKHSIPADHPVRREWALEDDTEVNDLLRQGEVAFMRQVCARMLSENATELFINRCACCGKVVASPLAQQCLWCGYDWHHSADGTAQ